MVVIKDSKNASNRRSNAFLRKVLPRCTSIALVVVMITLIVLQGHLSRNFLLGNVDHNSDSRSTIATSSSTKATVKNTVRAVSCSDRLRHPLGDSDPNSGMLPSPKQLINKTAPFWISLHNRNFDLLRWNSIMDKGDYYETGLTKQFQDLLTDKPKGLVIDVGMNIGWFTLLSRAMAHNVVGFDPNPIMHSRVCESLNLNDWLDDGSVTLYSYGLGAEEATLNLTTGKNPGGSSFDATRLAKKFRRQISVPVTTLDIVAQQQSWIANKGHLPIHLLKVDVEGHEMFVFQGAHQLLHSNAIKNIIMELSAKDLRLVSDLLSFIFHAGYKVQLLSTVNGDPYHPEMVTPLNEALSLSSVGMNLDAVGEEVQFLAKVDACNIWWVLSSNTTNAA